MGSHPLGGRLARLALAGLALAAPASASAAVSSNPDKTFVTDGEVHAVARSADMIYLGGEFTQVGPRTGPWVALSASSGQVNTAMPEVSGGFILATVSDGSGGFYLGGDFTHVGGLPRGGLAHIRADGSLDPNWAPTANGAVHALARSGSTVYVGGDFHGSNSINGSVTRNRAAAVNATTGAATGWDPNANSSVLALAVSGSTVYLGGSFAGANAINGNLTRNHLAAVDATTGTASTWDPNVNDDVNAIAVSGSNVYIGGRFAGAFAVGGGVARNYLAAIDASTGVATAWNPNANGFVNALSVSGSTVYIGGDFSGANSINGNLTRNHLAAVDATNGTANAWDPNAGGNVNALELSGSTVYLGGKFKTVNGTLTRNRLAAVDATTGTATGWDPNANGAVNALAVSGSVVAAGGDFASLGGQTRHNLAALNAADGSLSAWNPNAGDEVDALAVSGSTVYVGGLFSGPNSINGNLTRNNAAAVDATTGAATAWDPNANDQVEALAVLGSTVYMGGEFHGANSINGNLTRNYAAAVDAATGAATGWNPNLSDQVYALALSGSTVYMGGEFNGPNSVNGTVTRNRAAAVDASTGTATGWDPDANDAVNALAVSGDTVYLGGDFNGTNSIFGTVDRDRVAAVDTGLGLPKSWDPSADDTVRALAVSGSTVYIGGSFSAVDAHNSGVPRQGLAAVDATNGTATAWDPKLRGLVDALAPDGGGGVIAGGLIQTLDLAPQQGVAAFSQAPVNTAAPGLGGTGQVGQTLSCSLGTWSGTQPQSYARQWLRDGGAIAGAGGAGYTVTGADAGHALSCRVTASNLGGSASATSAAVNVPAAGQPAVPIPPAKASFAGSKSSITVGRTGRFSLSLRGTPGLTGTAAFASVNKVLVGRRQKITLAKKSFRVGPSGRVTLKIKLSKKRLRILKRNRKIRVRVTVTLKSSAGLTSTATKRITLKAPKQKRRR